MAIAEGMVQVKAYVHESLLARLKARIEVENGRRKAEGYWSGRSLSEFVGLLLVEGLDRRDREDQAKAKREAGHPGPTESAVGARSPKR